MPGAALAFDILARDKNASATLDKVGDAAEGVGGKLEGIGTAATAGFGVLAGAAAVGAKGLFDALDIGKANDKLAAQLGLSVDQAGAFGRAAGDLYADAYGDSLEEVNTALAAVQTNLGDSLGPADDALSTAAANALNLAETFDIDVNEAVERAGNLLKTDLAADADEAFDLVTAAMQRMSPALRDELKDATGEYGKFFHNLGISGSEMLGLFAQANDVFTLDKTGDALKEFTIRATDMSTTSVAAFDTLGENAEDMAGRILAGGDTAREALGEIVDGLLDIKDPVEQANTAIGLFGSPLEDLGTAEIPAFLTSLDNMAGGLGDVEGAAKDMGNTLSDNAATKIESFKRNVLQGLTDFIGISVIPVVEGLVAAFKEDGLAGAIDYLAERFPNLTGPLEVFEGIATTVRDDAIPALTDFVDWLSTNEGAIVGTLSAIAFVVGVWATNAVIAAAATWIALLPFALFLGALAAIVGIIYQLTHKDGEGFIDWLHRAAAMAVIAALLTGGFFQMIWGWVDTALDKFGLLVAMVRDLIGYVKDALDLVAKLPNPVDLSPGFDVPGVPWFDDGGVMPGQRGVHSLAWVAGGETILPTHKPGASGGGEGGAVHLHVTQYPGEDQVSAGMRALQHHQRIQELVGSR